MATDPNHHKEQGYEGSGLGPADHDADHQGPESAEDSTSNGAGQENGSDPNHDRSGSVPQENLGDS